MSGEYRGGHQPDLSGPGIHDVSQTYPDFYEHPEYYTSRESHDAETVSAIKAVRNRPDASIRIFRSAPHGVTQINPGDWVTPSRAYAVQHGMHPTDPAQDWPVISKVVPAKHVVEGSGNSIHEWGYQP